MATIKEIAELSGVSRGTVDRVLNNRGSVSAKTAEKVLEIAKALDYRPNKAGLTLAAQKKRLRLGVILFGNSNPFFDEVMKGVRYQEERLACYNCSILVRQIAYDDAQQLSAIEELLAQDVHGIVLAPYNAPAIAEKINALYEQHIPTVTVNTDIDHTRRIAYVGSNYFLSGETAGGLMGLMTKGEIHAGIVLGSRQILCHTDRVAGFRNCIRKKSPHIHVTATIQNQDDEVESFHVTQTLLQEHPEINALYFAAGGVYGGCKAIVAQNRAHAVTVITHDRVDTTRSFVQEGVISATICQQPFLQGSQSLDILFNYLTAGELPEKELNYVAADIRIAENI